MTSSPRYIALVGDVHGQTRRMVQTLSELEQRLKIKLNMVLQVGDFEPHRDEEDLKTMCSPSKYKHLGDFHEFYTGKQRFPWPVLFIGGNHEPHGYLEQHPRGGALIERCEYMGRAGVIAREGLVIAGLSGIYSEAHYQRRRPRLDELEYLANKQFIYFNEADVDALFTRAQEVGPVDILLLHEWPAGMHSPADTAQLEANTNRYKGPVGNDPAQLLVELLRPRVVACGHMHTRYEVQRVDELGQPLTLIGLAHIGQREPAVAIYAWHDRDHIEQLA